MAPKRAKRPVGRPKSEKATKDRMFSVRCTDEELVRFKRAAERVFELDPDRPNKLGTWVRRLLAQASAKLLGEE